MSILSRLNQYHIMWVIVFYDLPTETKADRKALTQFRKDLINDGFTRMQWSVYMRHCTSYENADVHTKRVARFVPSKGQVSVLKITDKQFGEIQVFHGKKPEPTPDGAGRQLELFF